MGLEKVKGAKQLAHAPRSLLHCEFTRLWRVTLHFRPVPAEVWRVMVCLLSHRWGFRSLMVVPTMFVSGKWLPSALSTLKRLTPPVSGPSTGLRFTISEWLHLEATWSIFRTCV